MTSEGGAPPPARAAQIAAGLWQAGEAVRLLIEQAEELGLPVPTIVNERLTWTVMKGLATYTQRYAEYLAGQAQPPSQPQQSGLVVATPDDVRRLLGSMHPPGQESQREH